MYIKNLLLILLIIIGISISARSQSRLSERDAKQLIETAHKKVEQLGSYLQLLGNKSLTPEDKDEIIRNVILEEIIPDQNSFFSNDLDPTGKLPKNLKIKSYLYNAKVGYYPPQKGGVNIVFESVDAINSVYKDTRSNQLFVKVVVRRSLEGVFTNDEYEEKVANTKDLDFYVKVFENGKIAKPISIYSMDFHKENNNLFKSIEIIPDMESIISERERRGIELELYNARRDVGRLNQELAFAKKEAQIQKEKADQANREKVFAQSLAEQAIREKELAKREKDVLERETKAIRVQANQNRISFKLGGGLSYHGGDRYHQDPSDKSVNSLYGTASLWWRITQLKKIKNPKSGLSIAAFSRYGSLSPYVIRGILGSESLNPVDLNGPGTFWDFEAGFVISQLIRISAGFGEMNFQDDFREKTKKDYFAATLGLYTPSLGNTLLAGFTLSARTLELPWQDGLSEDQSRLNTALNFYVIFQIQ